MKLSLVLSIVALIAQTSGIKFGSSYGSHMVLQRGPKRAVLYGYANVVGDTVTVYKNGASVGTAQVEKNLYKGLAGYWSILLPAESHRGPFTITASSSDGNVTLTDVLFGDVWVCSGQSNMFFTMNQVNNHTAEIQNALQFPDVRMLVSNRVTSTVEIEEANLKQQWMKPTNGHVNYFSAVCFMFGRNLQSHLKYPIGLIETSWGGTPVEAWSSHDALATCAHHGTRYCGEGDTLASVTNTTIVGGFPGLRWAQTADTGYVPNPKMPKTFMAVALDLPDYHSPYGAIHPRYKQDVATRLTLGAQAVAYGEKGVTYQGPFPSGFHIDQHHHKLEISFDQGAAHMIFHNTTGFEICCDTSATGTCTHGWYWHYASVTEFHLSRVSVPAVCPHGRHVAGVRYLWHTSPCDLRMCPLYGKTNYLPVPPFIKTGGFTSGTGIVG